MKILEAELHTCIAMWFWCSGAQMQTHLSAFPWGFRYWFDRNGKQHDWGDSSWGWVGNAVCRTTEKISLLLQENVWTSSMQQSLNVSALQRCANFHPCKKAHAHTSPRAHPPAQRLLVFSQMPFFAACRLFVLWQQYCDLKDFRVWLEAITVIASFVCSRTWCCQER